MGSQDVVAGVVLSDRSEAEQVRDEALARLETARFQRETELIEGSSLPVQEMWDPVVPMTGDFGASDPGRSWSGGVQNIPSRIEDRLQGEMYPVFRTEEELSWIRGKARSLSYFASSALSAVESLTNYTVGTGFTFEAQAKEGFEVSDGDVKRVQAFVDRFISENGFAGAGGVDREFYQRMVVDGEAFAGIDVDQGSVLVDLVEPDGVTEPRDKRQLEDWLHTSGRIRFDSWVPSWKFGVLTSERRTWKPKGYHLTYNSGGSDWDFVGAERMVHAKRNVPRSVKRGVSDFMAIQQDVEREAKLKANTAEGAAIQAAIAYIVENPPGTTRDAAASSISDLATTSYDRAVGDGGTRRVQVEQFVPGTIRNIAAGKKYHAGPLGSLRSPIFIEVGQYLLRAIGTRWSMPEYLISGDASNANFSSSLVSESPFVKAREYDQVALVVAFRDLIEKALALAHRCGMLSVDWQSVRSGVDVIVTPPEVATRDAMANVQRQAIEIGLGTLSRRTAAVEVGRDFDVESQNRRSDGDDLVGQGGGMMEEWKGYP